MGHLRGRRPPRRGARSAAKTRRKWTARRPTWPAISPKNIVAAGIADRIELQVSYAIGVARPLSLAVETFGTGRIPDEKIIALIHDHFDMRPAAIIRDLDLRRPIYRATASYGHFWS